MIALWLVQADISLKKVRGGNAHHQLESTFKAFARAFRAALDHLPLFVEDDMGGRLLQLTDTRILVLPPGIEGVRGVEDAAETVRPEGDGRRW